MDDAVTWPQCNAATGLDKVRKLVLGFDIDWLWISRRMAKRLHDEIGRKAKTGEFFKFVAGHRTGCILRANGCHSRFAIVAGAYARQSTCFTNNLLRQGIALLAACGRQIFSEDIGWAKT